MNDNFSKVLPTGESSRTPTYHNGRDIEGRMDITQLLTLISDGAFQGQELPLPVLIQLRDHIFPRENNGSEDSNSSESPTAASSPSTTTTTTFDSHFLSADGPNAQTRPQWYSQSDNAPNGFQPTPTGQDLPTTINPHLILSSSQPGVGPSTHFQHHTSGGTVYGVSQARAERRHGNHPYAAAQRSQALMMTTSTGPATQPDIIPTHPVPVPVLISVPAPTPAPASQPGRANVPQFLLDPLLEEQITCLYNNCTQGTFTGLRAWTHHLGTQHGVPAGASEGGICLYPGCGQQQKASFQRHIVSTHSGILYQCRQCSGKVSPRTDAMRRHCVKGAKAKATHRYFPRAPGVVYADEIRA